jgi:hypothetical protein
MAPELDALTRYLGRGGRVLAVVDPRTRVGAFKAWLGKAGVALDEDIVIDLNPFNQVFGGSALAPVIQNFDPSHPITKDLMQQQGQGQGQAIFPQTRSVSLGKLPEGGSGTALAHTLGSAFGWAGSGNRAPGKPGPGDKKGPLDLMVAVEAPVKAFGGDASSDKKARLVVAGTSILLTNQGLAAFNNQDLIVNSVRWLGDEEKRIALAPKKPENTPMMLDGGRLKLVWWTFFLTALAALGMGVLVHVRRRSAA